MLDARGLSVNYGNSRTIPSSPFLHVFPVPGLALRQPAERLLDAAIARLVALRVGDPFDVLALVAGGESVVGRFRLRVPGERLREDGWRAQWRSRLPGRLHRRWRSEERRVGKERGARGSGAASQEREQTGQYH